MAFKIHPGIGLARIGDSSEWFVDEETRDEPLGPASYRDSQCLFKRKGARFRVWEHDTNGPVAAAKAAGATVVRPARLGHVERSRDRSYRVEVVCGAERHVLRAKLLVDATGRSAWLSRKLGATGKTLDRLVGVARWVRTASPPAMLVEATRHGVWYGAPTPGGETVFLWTTDASDPTARAADPEVWRRCLASSTWTRERFGDAEVTRDASVRPAGPAFTELDPRAGLLPVGDAMVSFDPLSGSGLCFALRSALEAAYVIAETAAGNSRAVRGYAGGARGVLDEHLLERKRVYAHERRFSDSPFWQRARGPELLLA